MEGTGLLVGKKQGFNFMGVNYRWSWNWFVFHLRSFPYYFWKGDTSHFKLQTPKNKQGMENNAHVLIPTRTLKGSSEMKTW